MVFFLWIFHHHAVNENISTLAGKKFLYFFSNYVAVLYTYDQIKRITQKEQLNNVIVSGYGTTVDLTVLS